VEIARIGKGPKQCIRIGVEEYQGHQYIDVRTYFQNEEGAWVATKKGVTMNADTIDEVIEGLRKASDKLETMLAPKGRSTTT
jgi:hypothetical protein